MNIGFKNKIYKLLAMKQLFTLVFVFAFSILSFAQQSSVLKFETADTMYAKFDPSLDEYVIEGSIKNISNTTQKIKWKRKYLQIADNCESYICDINCYAHTTNESPVLTLQPNASIPILCHFNKECAANGGSSFRLTFHPSTDLNTVLYTVIFNCGLTTNISDIEKESVKITPNPASQYFKLKDNYNIVGNINVYNMTGRLIKNFDPIESDEYYIGDLPGGVYLVRLTDKYNKTIKTLRINKNNP